MLVCLQSTEALDSFLHGGGGPSRALRQTLRTVPMTFSMMLVQASERRSSRGRPSLVGNGRMPRDYFPIDCGGDMSFRLDRSQNDAARRRDDAQRLVHVAHREGRSCGRPVLGPARERSHQLVEHEQGGVGGSGANCLDTA